MALPAVTPAKAAVQGAPLDARFHGHDIEKEIKGE
jgi:hypothetical protein